MIGVVIPAHNEESLLEECLASVVRASIHPALLGEDVRSVVVLDDCTDGSARVARRWGVNTLCVEARNVGQARALGCGVLRAQGARWLANTDADSRVFPDWLAVQLALDVDVVCGVVEVGDWSPHSARARRRYESAYQDIDGHSHIHGANLGVRTRAYVGAGGFPPLSAHEDVALVDSLRRSGARIAWSARARVLTSARRDARARGGFGDYLNGLEVD
ncbi:glycosyltransferase [Cystobacter ferrugineus]|uniref:Glycosyl transferase n=1 Tax=Cystobacter ferrugineus TaxID=83449 RepID=A0A1L9ATS9_9BACT|nr:glycosyltransferase family 2 protein [Cystobacter ferrugineus]OJH33427.1 glycosyl transferase [Cystobacter ferrugineus]